MVGETPDSQPDATYRTLSGETLTHVLDVSRWTPVAGRAGQSSALAAAVEWGAALERQLKPKVRELLLSRLGAGTDCCAAPNAGLYRLSEDELQAAHRTRLKVSGLAACGSLLAQHASPAFSVGHLLFALASYDGPPSVYRQSLHRADAQIASGDSEEVLQLLEARCGFDRQVDSQVLAATRDLGERALLAHQAASEWRLGSGRPAPPSLLRPAMNEFVDPAIEAWKALALEHRRFLFVDYAGDDPILWTLGQALEGGEYALLHTLEADLSDVVLDTLTDELGDENGAVARMATFLKELRNSVVYCVFRASEESPPQVFYAHPEYAREAAGIAIADAQLQPLSGRPALLRFARWACEAAATQTDFNEAGADSDRIDEQA